MSQLDELEEQSVYIFREAYKHFKQLCMLWSIGKDSTVLLWLARKAFFGHVPFPLVHIDTSFKVPSMIAYRDRLAREWGLQMVVGQNRQALAEGMSHTKGRLTCCRALKTEALRHTLDGTWPRLRMGADGQYREEQEREPFTGVIVFGYGTPPGGGRSYKATVYVRDPALDARSIEVALLSQGGPVSTETAHQVEDAILARARQLRIQDRNL